LNYFVRQLDSPFPDLEVTDIPGLNLQRDFCGGKIGDGLLVAVLANLPSVG
jgi:hypothetical protein